MQRHCQGAISISPQVEFGYFSQELDLLNPEQTILNEVASYTTIGEARLLLACLLFRGDAVYKKFEI